MLWFVCPCLSGVAANCASALAQMAAASCVQEEKEERETAESGDAITQGVRSHTHTHSKMSSSAFKHVFFFCPVKQRLEQMSRPSGVRLHTAHVLCMDAILNVGLEMGSHNQDCWTHVFRYMNTLTHTLGV